MSDEFGMPMVDCRPAHEVIAELRQQVTLLRFKLFYANDLLMNTYHHVVPSIQEALAATNDEFQSDIQAAAGGLSQTPL